MLYLLSFSICRYKSGLVGASPTEQLSNPAIAIRPNRFLTFQADYEGVKAVTYSLQAFIKFQACYSDDIQCLNSLPSCSESQTPTRLLTDLTGSGESGDGVNMLSESEAGGDDTSDEEREELDFSGDNMYEDTNHRKNRYYYKIAREMPNTVSTCLSSGIDLSHLYTAQYEPSTVTPEDTTDWEHEFTLFIQTDNSTISTNSGSRNAGMSMLLLIMIVCTLTL